MIPPPGTIEGALKGGFNPQGSGIAWRAEIERAERTGRSPVTVREFCRSRGLREPSFYFWRREIARREGNRTAKREPQAIFAPVSVRPAAENTTAPIELEVAGFLLRVRANFDEAALARLIAVLRG